ncbi:MAG: CBS domain-containing protein [Chitinophagales bacterium]|nr:CBS domain-containing protein [Chitinophagales bacterium]MDW8418911.1 CBS domain-containing protein [Chitinophagales bacterium]
MKISASVFANRSKPLDQYVRELDALRVDMLHFDVHDDDSVFATLRQVRSLSATPIDLHIITPTPEKYIPHIDDLKIEYVSFQFESLRRPFTLPAMPNTKWGLCVKAATPAEQYAAILPGFEFLQVMCTTPGVSGGTFHKENFRLINEILGRFPDKEIFVDGGVNDEIAFVLRLMGVRGIVTGSYLANHRSLGAGLLNLHRAPESVSELTVGDFCMPASHMPVIAEHDCKLQRVLETIENYRRGFVLVTDDTLRLRGVITNADVRRALLRTACRAEDIRPEHLINRQPVVLHHRASLQDMIRLVNHLNFIILFLPVVDENQKIHGVILLNHLTRT